MQLGEVLKSPTFFVRLPGPKISAVFQGNSCACGCACLLSCMGAYNHMSVKPTMCFGLTLKPTCAWYARPVYVCEARAAVAEEAVDRQAGLCNQEGAGEAQDPNYQEVQEEQLLPTNLA